MGLPRKKGATYDDLRAVPDHLVAELIGGELITSPRPGLRHANAASLLGHELIGPFRRGIGGPGGWVILDEPELHLTADVIVPDLAGWRRERLAGLAVDATTISVAPDWFCEVLSPSTVRLDRARKLPLYAHHAVSFGWLLDPIAKTLEVLRLTDGQWLLVGTYEGDARVRAVPFEAVEIDLGILWTV